MKNVCVCLFVLVGGATGLRFVEQRNAQFGVSPAEKRLLGEIRNGAAPKFPADNSEKREKTTEYTYDGSEPLSLLWQLMTPNIPVYGSSDTVFLQSRFSRSQSATCDATFMSNYPGRVCNNETNCNGTANEHPICMDYDLLPEPMRILGYNGSTEHPIYLPNTCGMCFTMSMESNKSDPTVQETDRCLKGVMGDQDFIHEVRCKYWSKHMGKDANWTQTCFCADQRYFDAHTGCCKKKFSTRHLAAANFLKDIMLYSMNQTACVANTGHTEWCVHNNTVPVNATHNMTYSMAQCLPNGMCECVKAHMETQDLRLTDKDAIFDEVQERCDRKSKENKGGCAYVCGSCVSIGLMEAFGIVDRCAQASIHLDSASCIILMKKFNRRIWADKNKGGPYTEAFLKYAVANTGFTRQRFGKRLSKERQVRLTGALDRSESALPELLQTPKTELFHECPFDSR